jgi:hypothetical protein
MIEIASRRYLENMPKYTQLTKIKMAKQGYPEKTASILGNTKTV